MKKMEVTKILIIAGLSLWIAAAQAISTRAMIIAEGVKGTSTSKRFTIIAEGVKGKGTGTRFTIIAEGVKGVPRTPTRIA